MSDHPERVERVFVNHQSLEIERIWWHDGRLVFKFSGVDSISAAEPFAGADVEIPLEERAPLEEGSFYQSDLIGFEVIAAASGQLLGVVEDWQEFGGPPLLSVRGKDRKEILIPFAKSICREIDPAAKRIVVHLPEGLEDL